MTTRSPLARTTGSAVLVLTMAVMGVAACTDDDIGWATQLGASGGNGNGNGNGDRPTQAPPVPEDVGQAFDDAIDATRSTESAALTVFMMVGTQGLGFEGEYTTGGRGHVTAVDTDGQEMELRTNGETAWLRIEDPAVAAELPDGVTWVEAPREDLVDLGVVHELEDVWDVLPVLRGITSVDDLGVEDVEGVPVRKLRGDVDFEAALDASSSEDRAGLEETIRLDGQPSEIVAEVGLDGDGRVRSVELDIEVGDDVLTGLPMSLDYEMQAFNQTVEAPEAPPGDETVQLDDVPGLEELLVENLD